MANKENADLQAKIVGEWMSFSRTDAYKDWVQTMGETITMIQTNVDDMTEARPSSTPGQVVKVPIDSERAALINQRKMGIVFALQYPKLRIESAEQ